MDFPRTCLTYDLFPKYLPDKNPEKDTFNTPIGTEEIKDSIHVIPPLKEVVNPYFRGKASLTPMPKYINTILPLDIRTTCV